jgi:hypothetical protein
MVFIQRNAINGAHLLALWFIVVANALGAQVRVDYVDLLALRDRFVRALRFADVAIDAIVGDYQGHGYSCRGRHRGI